MMAVERIAVSPETVTVLGYRVKESDPRWRGLNFDRAEPRTQNSLMLVAIGPHDFEDVHLNVPFVHPEDKARGVKDDGCRYRVRPKIQAGKKWKGKLVTAVSFERWDGKWFIAIKTTTPTQGVRGR
jgi:hypothetical protein